VGGLSALLTGGSVEVYLGIASVALTLVAIVYANRIYAKENEELQQLGGITRKLQADTHRRESVRRFFSPRGAAVPRFSCVYPVHFQRRPLPSIYAGDYYAIQVFAGLLEAENMELYGIMSNDRYEQSLDERDVIFLCAPYANPYLAHRYGILSTSDTQAERDVAFDNLDLPCWFAWDKRTDTPRKVILVRTPDEPYVCVSAADTHYELAAELDDDTRYEPPDDCQRDFGIVMRITGDSGRITIVAAGIHQYGTWIAADFFNDLCKDPDSVVAAVLGRGGDFVAVVWGEFSTRKLQVLSSGVEQNFLWERGDGGWVKVNLPGV